MASTNMLLNYCQEAMLSAWWEASMSHTDDWRCAIGKVPEKVEELGQKRKRCSTLPYDLSSVNKDNAIGNFSLDHLPMMKIQSRWQTAKHLQHEGYGLLAGITEAVLPPKERTYKSDE